MGTLPTSLFTSSTCFSSRLYSSTSAYRTSASSLRYDRSNSTPLRSLRSESPGNFYNRAISELNIPSSLERASTTNKLDTHSCSRSLVGNKNLNQRDSKMLSYKPMPSNRYSYPMSSQAQKDHILRYSQRIADIFENSEEELDVESPKHNANKKGSNLSYVPRTSYKSIIDDVKAIEAKYKKMNEDVEEKRTKTELDYLRPSKKTFALPTEFTPLSKVQAESKSSTRTYSQFDNIENRRPTMSEKTIQLFRDASTPCPGLHTASSKQTTRNPARYLAANLRTDIYNRYLY